MVEQVPKRKDINVGEDANQDIEVKFNADKEKLNLAKWVLFGLLILSFYVISIYTFRVGDQSKEVFEFFKIAIPPIVTLILGAYFKNNGE
jgi:uncharacterized membrane protein